jgi:hypothetical protein
MATAWGSRARIAGNRYPPWPSEKGKLAYLIGGAGITVMVQLLFIYSQTHVKQQRVNVQKEYNAERAAHPIGYDSKRDDTQIDAASRLSDEQQKAQLRSELRSMHSEYRRCMSTGYNWHRTYGSDAANRYVAGMAKPQPTAEARKLNDCRSACRRYWSTSRRLIQKGMPPGELDEMASRHKRFTDVFQPLDKLEGYDKRDMQVYSLQVPSQFDSTLSQASPLLQ